MDSVEIVKITLIFLLSSVKFLLAPGTAIAAGYTPFEAMIITGLGGSAGITFFYYFGALAMRALENRRARRPHPAQKPKIFTRRNRLIVRMKERIGLLGLVFVTPAIISIPIGSIVAAKFFRHSSLTYPSLIISTWVWALFLSFFAHNIKTWILG